MRKYLFLIFLLLLIPACVSVSLSPADFSWPAEIVLKADAQGNVFDKRYSMTFNVKPVFVEEFGDSVVVEGKEIRLIRNKSGYYFLTSEKFDNVFLFLMSDGALNSAGKILISEDGISQPAFNQRDSYIELLTGKQAIQLTESGIREMTNE